MTYTYTTSKNKTYYLHGRPGGSGNILYFFAKQQQEGALSAVPDGYVVSETKNGMPVLRKAVAA